jgi:hypothetical protein
VQAFPHPPQLAGLVVVSMHTPLQSVCPVGHWHMLAAQILPPVQALPHAPQLALLDVVSTQPPVHAVRPVVHAA